MLWVLVFQFFFLNFTNKRQDENLRIQQSRLLLTCLSTSALGIYNFPALPYFASIYNNWTIRIHGHCDKLVTLFILLLFYNGQIITALNIQLHVDQKKKHTTCILQHCSSFVLYSNKCHVLCTRYIKLLVEAFISNFFQAVAFMHLTWPQIELDDLIV